MRDPRLDKLAEVLVRYSVGVGRGQLVSLVGPPLAEALLLSLYREVLRAGGYPFVLMAPEECEEELYRHGSPEQLSYLNPLEMRETELVDGTIHVLASTNSRALTNIDPARLALHGQARRPLMDLFLRRAADQSLRWVVTQLPCPAAAQDAEMSLAEYEDFVFRAGMLHHDDPAAAWQTLSAAQARVAESLQSVRELHFWTPRGTNLRVGVAGRTWINCDGRENFPDGEVFTGPIEDATEGVVCFDFPAVHGGREVQDVRLEFRAGRVVAASAAKGEDFLIRLLDQDAGARVLGEVAIGCNYAVARYTRNTLFDEKIGGTFHVALGASYPESGGLNRSGLHWDLVCDLRPGGRIEADGRVMHENGRFLDPAWPQPG
ncbi:MAG: aminopeptidase [Planctomycetes bacterium]|nr:aminopeptidase [Planctomycetota bacterium]